MNIIMKNIVHINLNKDLKNELIFLSKQAVYKKVSIRPFWIKIISFPLNNCSLKLACKIFKMLSLMFLYTLHQQL